MSKKIGVILSGSGLMDGSEIHEAVCTLLSLENNGLQAVCIAPDMEQMHVVDHIKGEPTSDKRNVLTESARIARGEIKSIVDINPAELDGLFFPGGFGAAKNLCDFAVKGADCNVNPEVENLVNTVMDSKKPIAAVCIAPALIARITGKRGIQAKLTIGSDIDTAKALEKMGAKHVSCAVDEIIIDEENRLVSGPAYMMASSISEIAKNIEQVTSQLKKML